MLKDSVQTEYTVTKIGNERCKIMSWIHPSVYTSTYQTRDSLEPDFFFNVQKNSVKALLKWHIEKIKI